MATRPAPKRRSRPAADSHHHQAGRCLHILRELSAFIDDELSDAVCLEVRRHLGACPHCEDFVASLRQTVSLCRRSPTPILSESDRAWMRQKILRAAGSR